MRLTLLFCAILLAAAPSAAELVCAGLPNAGGAGSVAGKVVAANPAAMQTHRGQVRALVLFGRFADESALPRAVPQYASRLFAPDQVGSLTHFYHTMSSGQFELVGEVGPRRYASLRPAAAYLSSETGKQGGFGGFVREILEQADPEVDFARYDNDGPDGVPNSGDDDGVVDYLFVMVNSTPRGFIIGGATGIATLGLSVPFVSADRGVGGQPIKVQSGGAHGSIGQEGTLAQTVGTMAHEFAHGLGLPDLYDLNYGDPEEDSAGVGRWCLMGWGAHGWRGDDGPNPMSAWCLKELGWIGPGNERLVEVEGDTTGMEVAALQQGGQVVQVPLPMATVDANSAAEEYLLLEQRTRSGSYYDRHLPGEGLLVWHIRPQAAANGDEQTKQVDLVCADGLYQDAGYPRGRQAAGRSGRDNLDFWAHDEAYTQAHNGNLGDATDPFDGSNFARLEKRGNPSIDPHQLLPDQTGGPALRLRRQGERMRLEVERLRWAGIIRQEVHWSGEILVDGDVQVAPEGRLVIHPGTQVRFAGSDRLHTGLDPGRSELDIQGEFIIKQAFGARSGKAVDKVSFAALKPGQSWYGIILNPARLGRIEVPDSSYELHGARYGDVLLPGAPPEARGKLVKQVRLLDDSGLETAGNGDGRLQPGETFRCVVGIDNWSLSSYEEVSAELVWSNGLVGLAAKALERRAKSAPAGVFPGTQLELELPPFTLSPGAVPGDSVALTLKLSAKGKPNLSTDRLAFRVEGRYPDHQAQFAVPGQTLRGNAVHLGVEQALRVEALVQGDIAGAELVLRTTLEQAPLTQVLLTRKGNRSGKRVFAGQVQLPEPGLYQARLRVQGAGGAVAFSPATLDLWVTADPDSLPVLAFLGEGYQAGERNALRQGLEQLAAEQGQPLYLVESAPAAADLYRAVLPHYVGAKPPVLWLGKTMNQETQDLFADLLHGGGRLGLIAGSLNLYKGKKESPLAELAYVQGLTWTSSSRVRSLYAEDGAQFSQAHSAMQLLAPAEPVLLDDQQQIAGMRLDTGTYRLVYLPFDLNTGNKEAVRHLLESTLAFLRGAIVQAGLELPGRERVEEVSLLPAGQRVQVQARAVAAQAWLRVRAFPSMDSVLEVPMRQQAGKFTASFAVPPEPGHYHLSLRLRNGQGNDLFNTAGLQALGLMPEQPFLLVLKGPYSARDQANLRALFADQAQELGLRAAVLARELAGSDLLYQALLGRYLAQAKTAVWLGGGMDDPEAEALRAFLGRGGQLLLASAGLGSTGAVKTFAEELVHASAVVVGNSGSRANQLVRSAGALEGTPAEFAVPHGTMTLAPPALPVLRDARGEVAGLRVDAGSYRLAYLPFELTRVPQVQRTALLGPLLSFLHRGEPGGALLEADGTGAGGGLLLTAPGRPLALRVRAEASAAAVVAFSLPGMDSVAQAPLRLEQGVFAGELELPAAGQYLLMSRLRRGDQSFFSGRSVQVAPYLFAGGSQVLVFTDERYGAAERQALKTELGASLGRQGLQADFVDQAPAEPLLYDILLPRYLGPGKLVVWLGRELGPEAQEAFRLFAQRGGRLLLASAFLHQNNTGPFLRQVFHIQAAAASSRKEAFAGSDGDFAVRYYPLTPEAPATAALVSRNGGAAALRLDTGIYRAMYLAFDPKNIDPLSSRGALFDTAFAFLAVAEKAPAPVVIKEVVTPGPVAVLGPQVPQVVVFNPGPRATGAFRVGYQVLRGERVLLGADQEEEPLAAGAERTLSLPAWVPAAAVDLQLRFGVKAAGDWVYQPAQTLRLVEPLTRFARQSLPGALDAGNGAGFLDGDSDGDLDLYLVRRSGANQYFRNEGGRFAEQGEAAGLADRGRGRGLALGDYDADGDVDLFVVNEEADRLYRNEGGGRFAEVTAAAAADTGTTLADEGSGRSAGFFDSDNDGDLDLFLANSSGPNRLFINEGGRFAERAGSLGLADEGTSKGLALSDWDNDGEVDLFVAIQNGGSRLYRNEGGHFSPMNEALGLAFAEGQIGPAFGDWDGDGDPDLFVANEWGANELWRNEGGRTFTLLADSLGAKSTGAGWGDMDNDGDLDLVTTAVNGAAGGDQLFQNRGQRSLVPVAPLVSLGASADGRGLSLADYDGDGNLDLFVADSDSSRLYHNEQGRGHWLEVELEGGGANRQGLGAQVELVAGGRRQHRQLFAAYGYASQGPARLHLGLGRATVVDTLAVRWPDGGRSVWTGVAADQVLALGHPGPVVAAARPRAAVAPAGLAPAYPNPFNAETLIRFHLALPGRVRVEIYDLLGQRVRLLADEAELAPGWHARAWDGRDGQGLPVASGVYCCRLSTGARQYNQRLLLLK